MYEACGPVTLNAMAPQYIGAMRRANNNAELAGGVECLLWLLAQALGNTEAVMPLGAKVACIFDSVYVVGLINGKFKPKHNIVLASLLIHLWQRASSFYDFGKAVWTKAHVGTYGNERADRLAAAGDSGEHRARQATRPFATAGIVEQGSFACVLNSLPLPTTEWQHHTSTKRIVTWANVFRLVQVHPIALCNYRTALHGVDNVEDPNETDVEEEQAHRVGLDRTSASGIALPSWRFFGETITRLAKKLWKGGEEGSTKDTRHITTNASH